MTESERLGVFIFVVLLVVCIVNGFWPFVIAVAIVAALSLLG